MESEPQFTLAEPQFASEDNEGPFQMTVDVSKSEAKLFTPRAKGVYQQAVADPDDTLLVHGYFREIMPNQILPEGVNKTIAAYYLKSYSNRTLMDKVESIRTIKMIGDYRRYQGSLENRISWLVLLLIFLVLIAKDIAMLIINLRDDCTLNTEDGESKRFSFGLSTWMNCAAIMSILGHSCFVSYRCASLWKKSLSLRKEKEAILRGDDMTQYTPYNTEVGGAPVVLNSCCACAIGLFLFAWTVIGLVLRYENGVSIDKGACKSVVDAWLWIELIFRFKNLALCCISLCKLLLLEM